MCEGVCFYVWFSCPPSTSPSPAQCPARHTGAVYPPRPATGAQGGLGSDEEAIHLHLRSTGVVRDATRRGVDLELSFGLISQTESMPTLDHLSNICLWTQVNHPRDIFQSHGVFGFNLTW